MAWCHSVQSLHHADRLHYPTAMEDQPRCHATSVYPGSRVEIIYDITAGQWLEPRIRRTAIRSLFKFQFSSAACVSRGIARSSGNDRAE